jgi:hypothetical protein
MIGVVIQFADDAGCYINVKFNGMEDTEFLAAPTSPLKFLVNLAMEVVVSKRATALIVKFTQAPADVGSPIVYWVIL